MRFNEVVKAIKMLVGSMVEEVYLAGYSKTSNSLT